MSSSGEEGGNGLIAEARLDGPGRLVVVVRPLVVLLDVVAQKRGMSRDANDAWVGAVAAKLEDIGVRTLRDFVRSAVVVNQRLKRRGHRELHETTLLLLLEEICLMVMGPEEADEDDALM